MGIGVGFPDSRSGLILRRIPLNSCDMLFVPILPDDFLPVGSEPTLSVCPFFHVPLGIRLTSESGYTCFFWLGYRIKIRIRLARTASIKASLGWVTCDT